IRDGDFTLLFRDNGLGIDLKKHGKKIFGMYKTFHKHKEAKGIGLFITKNQVEAMNGKISVESQVDEGTTFKVTLMIAQKKKKIVKA
ncbi:MAG: ATP-binding protein, partial [Flavobacteriales bacterium]